MGISNELLYEEIKIQRLTITDKKVGYYDRSIYTE
jgi:hypothetical protein